MPRTLVIDDDTPRRRPASRAVEPEPAPGHGLFVRLLLHSPKDLAAGVVAAAASIAIMANAMFMQPGRHPAPMFSSAFDAVASQSPATNQSANAPAFNNGPLPRPRPSEADAHADVRAADPVAPVVKAAPAPTPQGAVRPPAAIQSHADPVGDLIVSTRRISAVQRVLTETGYGQLKPTGVIGPDTKAAIERFERERKLPVTGQVSDRLVHELATFTGRTID